MELRLIFNEDETNYEKWRPSYVPALFGAILDYAKAGGTTRALEIGTGTGKATLPFLEAGCRVTGVEIGGNLAALAKSKFASYPSFDIIRTDFESFPAAENTYDLIYSATAFHWIPQHIGYPKVHTLLKPGGTLALFWNHPFVCRADDPLHAAIQTVYNRYRPSNKEPVEFTGDDCTPILRQLHTHGFVNVVSQLFRQTRTFTADGYIGLLNTYSDHRSLPPEAKHGLEQGIAQAITDFGGQLHVYDTMDLYLAQKHPAM